jgi:hypothetical protein
MKILELKTLKAQHEQMRQDQKNQQQIDVLMMILKERLAEHDRLSNKQDLPVED